MQLVSGNGSVDDYAQVYGEENISAGGLGYGDTVYGGGVMTVFAGGVDSAGVVSSGGNAFVSSGGTVTGETCSTAR